jgi:hypothetical protein
MASTAEKPSVIQWRYQVGLGGFVQLQVAFQVLQHAQVVQRVDFAGNASAPAHVRAPGPTRRAAAGLGSGWVSSRYSMMASDWPMAWPSSTSAGTSSAGLMRW